METSGNVGVEYNNLGRSGTRVSNICLGTATFGRSTWGLTTQINEDQSHEVMDVYSKYGGNFLDTADIYGKEQCERIVGNWLSKNNRRKFIIATKVGMQMDDSDVNRRGLSRRHIVESIEGSLERLQTHCVDLYQPHIWDNLTPLDETLRTFDDLIRCGKIRYFGVCNVCGWQLQKIVDRIDAMGLNKCVTLQQQYNLMVRQSEYEEFMVCQNEGIGILPWSPLFSGLLTGKFTRGITPKSKDSRIGYMAEDESRTLHYLPGWIKHSDNDKYWNLIDVMRTIGNKHGKSIAQVAMRWLLQRDNVVSVLTAVTSLKQLEENMGAATGWNLSNEEMATLTNASPVVCNYPYNMIWNHLYNPVPASIGKVKYLQY